MGHILKIPAPSHRDQLCQGIGRLLDSEVGCDFEISCAADSTPIKAHFFVLQIFSRVLQNSNCRRIHFESSEIQREDVRCLLEFVYRGKIRIEAERLEAVKRAAVKLGLEAFLDFVDGIHSQSFKVEVDVENETDTKIKEEVCESLVEDEDNVDECEDSSSADRDYTECSEDEVIHQKSQKSNVGKHELNGGMRKHLASKKYDLRSYQSGNQNAHLPTKHQMDSNGQVLEKRVQCDQCEYTCAAEILLITHIKNAHCETDKDEFKRRKRSIDSNASDHACKTCGKYYKTAKILREHKMTSLVHSEKVDCEICGKKFALNSILKHRKTHEVGGNRKFKCTVCALRCRDRYKLKIHLKNVHKMSEGKIGRLVYSEATRVSDKDPPQSTNDLGKIRRRVIGWKKRVPKH